MSTARSKSRPVAAVATATTEPTRASAAAGGVVIGFIADLDHDGCPRVIVPGGDDVPLRARSLCPVQAVERGRQCALMYENGDARHPLILGLLQHPVLSVHARNGDVAVERHGDELLLQADAAIELRCGNASLRLSADGRVEVRGTTLVSHATGLNRIRGASIKLN
jgi:hypothetical protein